MEHLADPVFLSRLQFAWTTMFHILWPLLTIGLSVYIFACEGLWLATRDAGWRRQYRFWTPFFLLAFAVGVASGLPLEFQFGTNWAPFSAAAGHFFGQILGFEGAMAFMLESAFLGVMVFGEKRVPAGVHLLATGLVALGASLSAFLIMTANCWLQTPAGTILVAGKIVITDRLAATFNPDLIYGFSHMWVACLETTAFALGGVAAWQILRRRDVAFYRRTLLASLVAAALLAPLQIALGDASGRAVGRTQPAKLAATEAHWQTNPPGRGASWALFAWPDPSGRGNLVELRLPFVLSLLSTHSPTGTVLGLNDIAPENRPPIVLPFYAFRIMAAAGTFMLAVVVWSLIAWRKGLLALESITARRRLLGAWVILAPLGFLATETGWIMREVGRQPWVVYGLIRTRDSATTLSAATVGWSLAAYVALSVLLATLFLLFARQLLRKGPQSESEEVRS
jgi:cytochrome d ubiquinol oxidase subunit I